MTRATRASSNLRPRRPRTASGEGEEPNSPHSGGKPKKGSSPRAANAKAGGGKKKWWGRAVSKKKGRPEKKAAFELANGTIENSPSPAERPSDNADSNSASEHEPSHDPAAERKERKGEVAASQSTNGSPTRSQASLDRRSEYSTKSAAPKIGIAF